MCHETLGLENINAMWGSKEAMATMKTKLFGFVGGTFKSFCPLALGSVYPNPTCALLMLQRTILFYTNGEGCVDSLRQVRCWRGFISWGKLGTMMHKQKWTPTPHNQCIIPPKQSLKHWSTPKTLFWVNQINFEQIIQSYQINLKFANFWAESNKLGGNGANISFPSTVKQNVL